jgi:ribosomal protein S18 acetylase RimI-like enzyme
LLFWAEPHSRRRILASVTSTGFAIRPVRPADSDSVCRVCLLTGDNGRDATDLYADPALLGQIYAAPYAHFAAECGFVVEDDLGLGGYILGAVDTAEFETQLERSWWPALRQRYADPSPKPRQTWTADDLRAWQIHHPYRTPERLTVAYPAHLHIDLEARFQGLGIGRRLMDLWLETVRALGSNGAHLGVPPANARALRFYRTYGWREVEANHRTVWLGFSLTDQSGGETPAQPGR